MIDKLTSAWWALRVGLGLGAFLAGLDKFFNLLADWGTYLSPLIERLLPVSGETFMRAVGVIEMAVGLLILAGFARIGGYVLMAWLVGIAMSLVTTGRFFDVAVRDVVMALAAFTLARLTEVREDVEAFAPQDVLGHGWGWRLWTDHAPLTTERGDPHRRTL
jgi:uncharacterized membrane protein YphA (DoxX/SURF4 family)